MVKSFKKMAYKNFGKGKKFSMRDANSDKKSFRTAESKEGKYEKMNKSKVKCCNCGEKGHFAPECEKRKADKSQTFIKRRKSN